MTLEEVKAALKTTKDKMAHIYESEVLPDNFLETLDAQKDIVTYGFRVGEENMLDYVLELLEDVETGPVDDSGLDEWCTDCKEYDHEKHCCPRYNRVIREALTEVEAKNTGKWIPCKERMPEKPKGKKEYAFRGEGVAADEYIVMIKGASIPTALLWTGDEWFYEDCPDITYEVIAWMPLPEPYKEKINDNRRISD